MARYFNFFPRTLYNIDEKVNSLDSVTNIIARYAFESSLKENTVAFYEYEIKDGETPEIIASKYYDSQERHWIVLLFNNIIDPQFDWPLEYRSLLNFIEEKYSAPNYADTANTGIPGLSWARNTSNIQSYYKVITQETIDTVYTDEIEVDSISYANNDFMQPGSATTYLLDDGKTITISFNKTTKSYFDYELEENEKKRKIKLLKRDFVSAVEKEFKRVIKT